MRHAAFKKKFKFELSQELKFTQEFKPFESQQSLVKQKKLQFTQQQPLRRFAYVR